MTGRREKEPRSALVVVGRLLGVALTAGMGWIHGQLWAQGYREVPVVGTLFLLNAIVAVALAVALLVVPTRLLSAAAAVTAAFTAGTLLGLVVSLTVGLFGVHESLQTPLVPATLVVESAGILVLGLTAVLAARSRRPYTG
ncbi:MAG TPA: hypothetical protein VIY28_18270 [Pseudonocardiaceae bacterium]